MLLGNTVEIAHSYQEGQCRTMARELNLMAGDINSAKVMFDQNRTLFHDWFATRSLFLGFPVAMMLKNDGSTIESVQHVAVPGIALPRAEDYAEASDTEPFCFVPRAGGAFARAREALGLSTTPSFSWRGRAILAPANIRPRPRRGFAITEGSKESASAFRSPSRPCIFW